MELLSIAERAARLAGQVLQDWAGRFTTSEKSRHNFVTEADLAAQRTIHEFISGHCPGHGFLGEEGLQEGAGAEYRWVIDPLDGTSNYVHGFPYYAVSIGLERRGELIVGAIYDPTRDEMFSAATGQGAKLNGRPIHVSPTDSLDRTMAFASLPINVPSTHQAIQRFLKAMESVQTVQRTGSAALNLCAVASGRCEVFWSSSLSPWDMAAGVVLVREAGGLVTRIDGGPFQLEVPNLLASNGTAIHRQLIEVLA